LSEKKKNFESERKSSFKEDKNVGSLAYTILWFHGIIPTGAIPTVVIPTGAIPSRYSDRRYSDTVGGTGKG
jgi:hypothetical protein